MTIEDKILINPMKEEHWESYISKLNQEGDHRGRLLELNRRKKTKEEKREFLKLIQNTDRFWVAKFVTFRGRVNIFREIEIEIATYGSAPKKYGNQTYKVDVLDKEFLIREGWADLGEGRSYGYVKPPLGFSGKANRPNIKVFIPSKDEIVKLAFELAKEASPPKAAIETFGPWICKYEPGNRKFAEAFHALTVSKEGIDDEVRSLGEFYTKQEYCFGIEARYRLKINWDRLKNGFNVKEYFWNG